MKDFSSQIFRENEEKTHNLNVSRERPYLIGFLILLIGMALHVANLDEFAVYFTVGGVITLTAGRIIMSGKLPSVGHRPYNFTILKDAILIGEERVMIDVTKDLRIVINSYKGQFVTQSTAFYQTYPGTNNKIEFSFKGRETEFYFVLDSEYQKDKLIRFCEEHAISYVK